MATTTRTIEVRITGEDAGASKALDKVGGAVSSLGAVALGVAAGGLAALVGGLGAISVVAFDAALDFDNASKKIQASMGLLPEEAEKFDKIITQVYRDNFGDSMADVGQAVTDVGLKLKTLGVDSEDAITSATENALSLRDAFDVDVSQSIDAASELVRTGLVDNFDEAFDLITSGFQQGLNSSGDFLDSISEYSTQFAELDATGAEFFSALKTGLAGGVLGTDKIGDSFKEFRLRVLDGSDATQEALAAIFGSTGEVVDFTDAMGKSGDKISKLEKQLELATLKQSEFTDKTKESTRVASQQKIEDITAKLAAERDVLAGLTAGHGDLADSMDGIIDREGGFAKVLDDLASGELRGVDAAQMIIEALAGVEDKEKRIALGTALLGPQFEDLGDSTIAAVNIMESGMEDLVGSTDSLGVQYDTLGSAMEGLKRIGILALKPIGDIMLDLANQIMPVLKSGLEKLEPVINSIAGLFSMVFGGLLETKDPVTNFFDRIEDGIEDMIPESAIEPVYALINALRNISKTIFGDLSKSADSGKTAIKNVLGGAFKFLIDNILPALTKAINFINEHWEEFKGAILGVGAALAGAGIVAIIAAVGSVIGAIASPILAIVAAAALLGAAWAGDWGGIRTIITEAWEGTIKPALMELWEWLSINVPIAIEKVTAFFNDVLLPIFKSVFGQIQETGTGALSALTEFWAEHGENVMLIVTTFLTFIWTRIQSTLAAIQNFWDKWGDEIIAVVQIMWTVMQALFKTALKIIGGVISAFAALIKGDWSAFGDALVSIWTALWEFHQTIMKAAFDIILLFIDDLIVSVKESWSAFVEGLQEMWERGWDNIAQAISNAKQSIIDAVNKIINGIKALFTADKFKEIGTKIADGLKQGLSDSKAALIEFIKGIAGDMIQAVKDMFGIASPSKVFVGIGQNVNKGMAMGIAASSNLPAQAIQNTASSVVNNTTNIFNQTINGGVPSAGREFEMMRSEAVAFGS